ncbi:hypothetical protein L0F63_006398 [Massospora cicadina]|nr:hypothetical protein L0F63_006398 [Massospora cicadina]
MNEVIRRLPASGYKMGDLFTLTVEGETVTLDSREYYSGRGAKYNSGIKHGNVTVTMTMKQLNEAYKPIAKSLAEAKKLSDQHAKYLRNANSKKFVQAEIERRVLFVADHQKPANDDRYWLGVYRGCGAYRLVIADGKIVAAISGGYHDSCPLGTDIDLWISCVNDHIASRMAKNEYSIVKAEAQWRKAADDLESKGFYSRGLLFRPRDGGGPYYVDVYVKDIEGNARLLCYNCTPHRARQLLK